LPFDLTPAGQRIETVTRASARRPCVGPLVSSSPSYPGETLLIRPSWRSLGRWERRLAGLLVLGGAIVLVRLYGRHPRLQTIWITLGIFGVILAGYASYVLAYMVGTSIRVTADAILVTHWFWSTAAVPRADIARVVRCSVGDQSRAGSKPVVFAFSPTGRCVLSLYAFRWDQADLDRIWPRVGITPEGSWDDVITDESLTTRFPGAF